MRALFLAAAFGACATAAQAASAPLTLAPDGHFTTPVTLNGQGPYDFTVDTGAQRPVLAPDLGAKLQLTSAPGVEIRATSGAGAARMTYVRDYKSGLFDLSNEMMAILPNAGMVTTGVVGMDAFTDKRLELNFADHQVTSGESAPTPKGFVPVPAMIVAGSFIIIDVVVDGVKAKAMVDSGARRTIVNSLLQKALGFKAGDPRLTPDAAVGGATKDTTAALKATVGSIAIGSIHFDRHVVTFADVPVLQSLGLSDRPAMILGLDALKTLKAMAIDYPRAELQIKS